MAGLKLAALAILLGASLTVAASVWPVELGVSRAFHETPRGLLHYVHRGDLASGAPLVLFHGDPRSSTEFRFLVEAFPTQRAFVAVDFYGMGASDDCRCGPKDFVKFEDYAAEVLKILSGLGVKQFIPVGNLKGAGIAVALADLAAGAVRHVVLAQPLVLCDSAKEYLLTSFIPRILNPALNVTGFHLTQAWKDPSAAPALQDDPQVLAMNQEKTLDALRCRNAPNGSGTSKYQFAWIGHNEELLPAVRRVAQHARFLFMYSDDQDKMWSMYGLCPEWSKQQFSDALAGADYVNRTFYNGEQEGWMMQNALELATEIEGFLGKTLPTSV